MPMRGSGLNWEAWLKGSSLYQTKRGSDEITSTCVTAIQLLLNSLTHADGGMATVGSKSVSSFDL